MKLTNKLNKFLRIFFIFIFFIFNSLSYIKANDVKDFEIEGMSIGDSLLDYMDEGMILNEIEDRDISVFYEDKYIGISTWDIRDQYELYDDVGVTFKTNDKNYEIYALEGTLHMEEDSNIQECHDKQNEIINDMSQFFNNIEPQTWFVPKDQLDPEEISVKYIEFNLKDGGKFRTICYEIQKGIREYADINLLYVTLDSKEFVDYIRNR